MKRLATLLTVLLVLTSTVQAQDRYYYSDERKIPIEQAEQWKVIQIPENAQSALSNAIDRRSDLHLREALAPERGFYWLEAKGQQALGSAMLNQLSQQVSIQRTVPAFFQERRGDTTHFVMIDEFNVQFKRGVSRTEIDALNEKHGVEVAPFENAMDRRQARQYNEYL